MRYYSSIAEDTTLTTAVNSTDTSLVAAAVVGYPSSYPYTLVIAPDTASEELVTVTNVSGVTFTVTRGVDGTTGVSHPIGTVVKHAVSARDYSDSQSHIAATAAHGISGAVVGTTDVQTVSAKTLTSTKSVGFNMASPGTTAEGVMAWNATYGTLEWKLKGGNVTLQAGQETVARVVNAEASQINDGQVVYLYGASGNLPEVRLAKADSEATSSKVIGVATENIAAGQQGYVTLVGMLHDIDTSLFAEGASLYLSAATAGAITTTAPAAPDHSVWLGVCVRSHASVGQIFVNPQNGYELSELHDVTITTPTSGQVLQHDGTKWVNATPAAAESEVLLSTTSLSGSSVTISGISQAYKHLKLRIVDVSVASGSDVPIYIRPNNVSANAYMVGNYMGAGTTEIGMGCSSAQNNLMCSFDIEWYTQAHAKTIRQCGKSIYGGNTYPLDGAGFHSTTAAFTSLVIVSSSGSAFDAGTAYLYGVN